MNISFKNKVVVVTGAAGAIGGGIVDCFAQDGAKIALCDLRNAKSKAEEYCAKGYTVKGYEFDISDRAQVVEAMKTINDDFGGIDILVNNAGINVGPEERKHVDNFSDKWWDMIVKIDLEGTFNCTKAALEYMSEGASIVNISSVVGMVPLRNQCAFAAAKAGVINFTKAIAMELADRGIRANVICPGSIAMNLTKELWSNDSVMQALLAHIPMKRQGTPDEIAHATVFLASEYAQYITGAVLPVDGGWTCGGYARNF